ncbi:MAG: ABC transporter substrate-binding protein [Deltaproteobacteria bacterium]|nr:ABC transporter substrate-binding protein [Deltaproteobacteria bacterium]
MRRVFIGTSLIAFLFVFFSATQGVFASDNVWRIGTIYPLTGPNAKNGIKNFDGVKIATEMINEAGGVLGKKVMLVSADAPDPQAAASEANRLITNERITAIIGTQSSSLSMAATVVAEKNKIFYIETEGVSGLITARGFKYLFRTTFSGSMMAIQMVDFSAERLASRLGKTKKNLRLAIVHEDGGFGTSTGKGLKARAKALGLNVVSTQSYSAKSKLKQAKPDILLAAQYINDSILFHRQAKELRFKTLVFGTTAGQGNPDFVKALGKYADGVLAGGIPAEISIKRLGAQPNKDAAEFVRRYKKTHRGEYPNPTSFVGFAGAWIFYKFILPKAGTLDPDKLRAAALSLDIKPGHGVLNWGIKFAKPGARNAGQNLYASAGINQWQDGHLKLIYPREIATADLR